MGGKALVDVQISSTPLTLQNVITTTTVTFIPGATKVVLSFLVTGISYKKLAANAKIYRSVSDAISEGIAFVASSTSPEYAGISMHHVLVKLSAAGGVYDDVQARAAIASPDTADPMVLWSKMVTSSQDIRRTVET